MAQPSLLSLPDPPRSDDLDGVARDVYGEQYNAHLLEQYKLYVQMADKISDRRQSAHTFFLSINTGLVLAVGALKGFDGRWTGPAWYTAVALAGIALCVVWDRLIHSYKQINGAKFNVVHELELRLPCRPYDAEWSTVGRGRVKEGYLPFTHVETAVPRAFGVLYFAIAALTWIAYATQR